MDIEKHIFIIDDNMSIKDYINKVLAGDNIEKYSETQQDINKIKLKNGVKQDQFVDKGVTKIVDDNIQHTDTTNVDVNKDLYKKSYEVYKNDSDTPLFFFNSNPKNTKKFLVEYDTEYIVKSDELVGYEKNPLHCLIDKWFTYDEVLYNIEEYKKVNPNITKKEITYKLLQKRCKNYKYDCINFDNKILFVCK